MRVANTKARCKAQAARASKKTKTNKPNKANPFPSHNSCFPAPPPPRSPLLAHKIEAGLTTQAKKVQTQRASFYICDLAHCLTWSSLARHAAWQLLGQQCLKLGLFDRVWLFNWKICDIFCTEKECFKDLPTHVKRRRLPPAQKSVKTDLN